MWRVSAHDREGKEVARCDLAAGEVTIGRDVDRKMVLSSASVSRRHARVYVADGRPWIADDGSANGVLVDGVRIAAPTVVSAATRIEVAEFRIAVEPMLMTERVQRRRSEPGPATSPSDAAPFRLVAEGGPYDGRVFDLTVALIAVGRSVENDIVLDDPSLSRKHAKLHHVGNTLEVEDLGSSNGTFVNGRRVGRGALKPNDELRFGELHFRVAGELPGTVNARSLDYVLASVPVRDLYLLGGGAVVTLIMLMLAIVALVHTPRPVPGVGKEAIARIARQADVHLRQGRALFEERRYSDARIELDQAVELDPANVAARRLRELAARAPDEERAMQAASTQLALGDKKGMQAALRLWEELSDESPPKARLAGKLVLGLMHFGTAQCATRNYPDCAWALCKAYAVAPPDGRPDPSVARMLRDAEKKIRDPRYLACKAAP
jgi:pSer/pThr/pTyr-binding forkhead associated (FHA) protein